MKFLADENFYIVSVEFLRNLGYDILTLEDLKLRGISDDKIIELCNEKERILLTFDQDFADIRFLPKKCPGIIVLRTRLADVEHVNEVLSKFFREISQENIKDRLVILESNRYRARKI